MPPPNPKLIDLDFSPEAGGALPAIINMPAQIPGMEGSVSPEVRQIIDQLQQTAWEAKARLRTVEQERDALTERLEEGHRINKELRSRLPETAAPSRAGRPSPDQDAQLTNLRLARDAAQATARELTDKLALAEDELDQLREELASATPAPAPGPSENAAAFEASQMEIAALHQQREEVLMQLEIVSKEVLGLRQQLAERTAEAEATRGELARAAQRSTELELSMAPLRAAQAAAQANLDEALTSLAAAQKQIDRIIKDRDEAREGARQQNVALAAELEQKRAQIIRLETTAQARESELKKAEQLHDALARAEAEKAELAERFEAQRLQTIDLGARLEEEQRQIRLMSSRLAEARLQFKASGGKMEEPAETRPMAVPPPLPEKAEEVPTFDTAQALDAIRAMRRCYHSFAKDQDDLSHLNELHCQIHGLAEHANTTGFTALHRLASAFDTFVQELYHFPEQITPTSLHTVPETIEFLASLMKMKDLRALKDAATATVYVVEDDPLTCECITMAMETSMMRGISSIDPAQAAIELAGTACDLIFLDINMPGMDGFELCSEIRQFALHRNTPIVFLSGMATPELRARAGQVGGTDFLAKPFILCELTLKALVHISKAHLHMA